MIFLIIFLACLFLTVGIGVLAGLSDVRRMLIPNIYSVIIAMCFLCAYGGLWLGGRHDVFEPFVYHVLAAAVVWAVTFLMFMLGGIGAGDSKLATALALWTGLKGLIPFLLYMSIWGGLLGIAALILRRRPFIKAPRPGSWIEKCQSGESKVPYGVAIVGGALVSFVNLGYFSDSVLHIVLHG